ncbi:MAG TPA: PIN domain-containing protein [Terriglobia bacterium]|nr:PIN domain-containing protein [Terriglobia bacterium]
MPMRSGYLVDTNILIYAYDRGEPGKLAKAQGLLRWLEWNHAGALSTQVLAEFFCVATRRLAAPLSAVEAAGRLEAYLTSWNTLSITPDVVREAARGAMAHQLPYWDAQLWATARMNQIPTILSEDFTHERRIEGVQFVNPFIFPFWEKDAPKTARE